MSFMQTTWNEEQLERLSQAYLNQQIVKAIVRSVGLRKMPVTENGRTETKEVETAVFEMPGGIRAFCPIHEFADYKYRGIKRFVGTEQEFIIKKLDLDSKVILASVKEADKVQKEAFIDEIKMLKSKGELQEETYEGRVLGINEAKGNVFVKIRGSETYMTPNDWDHNRDNFILNKVQIGETIQVKVISYYEDNNLIRVSRKAAMENPWERVESFKNDSAIAGVVTGVDPVHGIFIRLDTGVELKGEKPKSVERPDVGDRVSCKIKHIDVRAQKGKVVITGYPNGKKTKQDVGDFLFSNG